jgi:YgiT-type zinc finger domain-containing protein
VLKNDEPIIPDSELTIPCTECQGGKMHHSFVTYFTWLGDEMITVSDFPAWVCDVCGRREYDIHALNQLSLILSPNAGRPAPKPRAITKKSGNKGSRVSPPK